MHQNEWRAIFVLLAHIVQIIKHVGLRTKLTEMGRKHLSPLFKQIIVMWACQIAALISMEKKLIVVPLKSPIYVIVVLMYE